MTTSFSKNKIIFFHHCDCKERQRAHENKICHSQITDKNLNCYMNRGVAVSCLFSMSNGLNIMRSLVNTAVHRSVVNSHLFIKITI